ncbi:MAG: hypothetical protein HYV09_26565 [Deltaproteobacteria bacterium]|nr:hypothetical protein [Deltaproteobacteria bacterium]
MSLLFADGRLVAEVLDRLQRARSRVRAAERHTTKLASHAGQAAHRALHEGELDIEAAIALLGGQ